MDERAKRLFKVRDLVHDAYWRLMDENGCAEAWTPPRRLNDEQLDRLADEITDYYEEVSSASTS